MKRDVGAIATAGLLIWILGTPTALCGLPTQQKPSQAKQQEEAEPETESEKAQRQELERKACGPPEIHYSHRTDKRQRPTPEPLPDKALVYVIRPTKMGGSIQTKLAVDGEWKGVNRGNSYFFFTLDPGEHHFCSQAENKSVLSLTVEPGKTYYLQQKIRMGWMKAKNKLAVVDEDEGEKGLRKCRLSISEVKEKR